MRATFPKGAYSAPHNRWNPRAERGAQSADEQRTGRRFHCFVKVGNHSGRGGELVAGQCAPTAHARGASTPLRRYRVPRSKKKVPSYSARRCVAIATPVFADGVPERCRRTSEASPRAGGRGDSVGGGAPPSPRPGRRRASHRSARGPRAQSTPPALSRPVGCFVVVR